MVPSRRAIARSRNVSLAYSSISLPYVSRIGRQGDGAFAAPLTGRALSLAIIVSPEEEEAEPEGVSVKELGDSVAVTFIVE